MNNNETKERLDLELEAEQERLIEMIEADDDFEERLIDYERGDMDEDQVTEFERWYKSEFPLSADESKKERILYTNGLHVFNYIYHGEDKWSSEKAKKFEKRAVELVGREFMLKLKERREFDRFMENYGQSVRLDIDEILLEHGISKDALSSSMSQKSSWNWISNTLCSRVNKLREEIARKAKTRKKKN